METPPVGKGRQWWHRRRAARAPGPWRRQVSWPPPHQSGAGQVKRARPGQEASMPQLLRRGGNLQEVTVLGQPGRARATHRAAAPPHLPLMGQRTEHVIGRHHPAASEAARQGQACAAGGRPARAGGGETLAGPGLAGQGRLASDLCGGKSRLLRLRAGSSHCGPLGGLCTDLSVMPVPCDTPCPWFRSCSMRA